MHIARNVIDVLALNPTPTVQVQSQAASPLPISKTTQVSSGLIATGRPVESKPGEALVVPAPAPAAVVKAVPESGFASGAKAVLAALYSILATVVLDALLDYLVQPGALGKIVPHEGVALVVLGALTWWRNSRRAKVVK